MVLKWLLAPLVGGVIGYITNDLAIKMLFHPRKTVYISRFKLPFTPGLIPKQKKRIAASIGRVISNQLLNGETMRQTLLSPESMERIRAMIQRQVDRFADDERTVQEVLTAYAEPDKIDDYRQTLTDSLTDFLMAKLLEARLGDVVVEMGVQALSKSSPWMMNLMDEKVIRNIRASASAAVERMIRDNARAVLEKEIDKTETAILDMKMSDIYARNRQHIPAATDHLMELYRNMMENNMDKLLAAVNIEQIVVDKVSSFKAEQLENMIFGIMKRELNAIVYLGAALGFLMGFINLLF